MLNGNRRKPNPSKEEEEEEEEEVRFKEPAYPEKEWTNIKFARQRLVQYLITNVIEILK
jgi:hypothetical protein